MEAINKTAITVQTTIKAPIAKVWQYWTEPEHIKSWCHATDDWQAPYAENNLQTGGKFVTTMAAKDGSMSFDFAGTYDTVNKHQLIEYTLNDGRKVSIRFNGLDGETQVTETFEAEDTHPLEMQRSGWQAILDKFKNYTETH